MQNKKKIVGRSRGRPALVEGEPDESSTMSFRVPKKTRDVIAKEAKKRGLNQSELFREIWDRFVSEKRLAARRRKKKETPKP